MQTMVISSWQAFVDVAATLDGWAFRGQQDERWQLESSLSRYLKAYVRDSAEGLRGKRVRSAFSGARHTTISPMLRCCTTICAASASCNITVRPRGCSTLPSRRLWQRSLHSNVRRPDAALFALNTPALWLNSGRPHAAPTLTRDTIDPRVKGKPRALFSRQQTCRYLVWRTLRDGRTLDCAIGYLRRAWRTGPPRSTTFWMAIKPATSCCARLFCPSRCGRKRLKWLYRMNITNVFAVPDLDGLARSIALELEMVWPTQRPRP